MIGGPHRVEGRFTAQRVGERNLRAVAEVAGALPLMFAATPEITEAGALLETVDGILLTGARANVHPTHFGAQEDPRYEPYDRDRDALALGLIKVCVARGVPLLGICRGFQEMNVAFGGTLHQKLHEVPGNLDHRDDESQPLEVQYGPAHDVTLEPGGTLRALSGTERVRVNSLHSQGIERLGDELEVEARAPDGVIEAFRVRAARAFALAVQWHPEWHVMNNPFSRALFAAFGQASRERAQSR